MKLQALFILGIGGLVASSQATILTFDIDNNGAGQLLQGEYGDNVTTATMGSFHYDVSNGTTPDVTTSYLGQGAQAELNWWSTGYSDLTNVAEYEPDGAPGYSITLTAAAGWNVVLNGFDLGNFGGEITVPSITVLGDGNAVLAQFNNFVLTASNTAHSPFSFGPALQGQSLTINFDLTGLGGNSDNVGIDNISFNQVAALVPEPATMGALAIGIAALVRRRRTCK